MPASVAGSAALAADWRNPPPARPEAAAALAETAARAAACAACPLHLNRTRSVFGTGHPNARLMFVGEAPGPDEDQRGEPFIGRSGQLLGRIIAAMRAERGAVYLTNVALCRLDDSRQLTRAQTDACRGHLEAQIAAVRPAVIVALGSSAWTWFSRRDKRKMADVRGSVHRWRGTLVVPTYHPAFLLRIPAFKRDVWTDMQTVMRLLEGGGEAAEGAVEIDESPWLPKETRGLFD